MADNDPNLDLPELEEKSGFPWIPLIAIVVAFALAAGWILYGRYYRGGSATAVAGLEQQLVTEKAALDEERNKVFDMTNQLEAMKNAIASGQVKDRKKAVAEYNQLAAEQNAQRQKVKTLANQYNTKVAKLQELK